MAELEKVKSCGVLFMWHLGSLLGIELHAQVFNICSGVDGDSTKSANDSLRGDDSSVLPTLSVSLPSFLAKFQFCSSTEDRRHFRIQAIVLYPYSFLVGIFTQCSEAWASDKPPLFLCPTCMDMWFPLPEHCLLGLHGVSSQGNFSSNL